MRTNNFHGILVSGCCHMGYDGFMNRKNIIYKAHNWSVLTLKLFLFCCRRLHFIVKRIVVNKTKKVVVINLTIGVSIELAQWNKKKL